ncbi:18043_t:CDS:2, partial [Acaulospora morrowiae]
SPRSTSGNLEIDKFLEETIYASNTNSSVSNDISLKSVVDKSLKWIPYEEFSNLTKIGEGGSGIVYSAIWNDAPEQKYDLIWNKRRVVLKVLVKSGFGCVNFLDKLRFYYQCMSSGRILPCYGISREPLTNHYILVMQYASEGDLGNYVRQAFGQFDWWKRIDMLRDVILGLNSIHSAGLIHQNFHSGNILVHGYGNNSNNLDTYISDLGMYHQFPSTKIDNDDTGPIAANRIKVFGVLPYIAPEARPTVDELLEEFRDLSIYRNQINRAEVSRLAMVENLLNNESKRVKRHAEAFYSSRLLEFENLPRPINAEIDEDSEDQDDSYIFITNEKIFVKDLNLVKVRRRAYSVTSDDRHSKTSRKDRRSMQIFQSPVLPQQLQQNPARNLNQR